MIMSTDLETGAGSLSAEDREPTPVSWLPVIEMILINSRADRKPSPVSLSLSRESKI